MAKALSLTNLTTAMAQNNIKMKEWVNTQIGNVKVFNILWVETLPTTDISTSTIYMVKDASSTKENNIYTEYVYNETESKWETLGQVDTGTVNLEGYYTSEQIDTLLANLNVSVENYTDEEITEMITTIWSE